MLLPKSFCLDGLWNVRQRVSVKASGIDNARHLATDWARGRQRDQVFFSSMPIATALTIFAGFARPYYLKTVGQDYRIILVD